MNKVSLSYKVGDITYTVSLELDNEAKLIPIFKELAEEAEKNG